MGRCVRMAVRTYNAMSHSGFTREKEKGGGKSKHLKEVRRSPVMRRMGMKPNERDFHTRLRRVQNWSYQIRHMVQSRKDRRLKEYM